MKVRLLGPFDKALQGELRLPTEGALTLRELVRELSARSETFRSLEKAAGDAELGAHVNFVCRGRLLRLDDRIEQDDTVYVMLPVTGG